MERFLNKPLKNKLKASAISSIWFSHAHAFNQQREPYEPDHVASLIINGLPRLDELWTEELSKCGLSVKITGVFCHQYPRVEFQMRENTVAVELADLLVVRRHHSKGKIEREVATLIQSKMSGDSTKEISNDDPQYFLYDNWPDFNFKQSEYSNHSRNIGKNIEQSKYSLIWEKRTFPEHNTVWPDSCFWSVVDNLKLNMESDESFASFLQGMVTFERGRDFFSEQQIKCEWTKTILELLNVTFNKGLKTRIYKSPKRGSSPTAFLLSGVTDKYSAAGLKVNAGNGGHDATEDDREDSSPGISTILIETFDTEDQNKAPLNCMRPAKSSTQPRKAKTWCALKFKWAPVLAF